MLFFITSALGGKLGPARSFRWLVLILLTLLIAPLSACQQHGQPTQETENRLYGMAAVSPSDIWTVGTMTVSLAQGGWTYDVLLEHWDGRRWTTVPFALQGSLSAVAALASNDVWAVGSSILHWDGARWSQVSVPNASALSDSREGLKALTAISPHDIWAAGEQNFQPVLRHWDGQTWRHATLPTLPDFRGGGFNTIQAISATDIWAAGWYEKPESSATYTLVEHWNGKNWQLVPTPDHTGEGPSQQLVPTYVGEEGSSYYTLTDAKFVSLVALASNNIWALGDSELSSVHPSQLLLEHWDGTGWKVVVTSVLAGTNPNYPQHIFAGNPQDIWITGYQYSRTSMTNYPFLLHWDGQSWQVATPSDLKATSCELYAGTKIAFNNLWIAGSCGGVVSPAPTIGDSIAQTLVEQWNGATWNHVPSPNPGQQITIPAE